MQRSASTFIALAIFCFSAATYAADFKVTRIDRGAPGNRMTDMKMDSLGNLHLIYTGCSDNACEKSELFHAMVSSTGKWLKTSVDDNGGDTGWFPSLSIDEQNGLHVFYANHEDQKMRYAYRDPSGQWKVDDLGKGRGGWWTSSAVSNKGLFVAHTRLPKSGWEPAALEVGTLENGKWNFEIVDHDRNAGWFSSMALNKEGLPVISYTTVFSQPQGFLKLAQKTKDGWEILEVDGGVIKSHVAVDSMGWTHVVYQRISPGESSYFDLMHLTNAPDGEWKKVIVEDGAKLIVETGGFPRIAIDAKGGLHIAYVYKNSELRYARKLAGQDQWEFKNIDPLGNGVYPWILIDTKGRVHVSYEKGTGIHHAVCETCATY
ncbi:MAG: hypothetical protein AABZ55_15070 [Bdellovibrionota bacterium]